RAGRGGAPRLCVSRPPGSYRSVAHRLQGEPVPRLLTGGAACYRIYETADGRHVTVAALEPKFWRNLCALLDRPDFLEHAFDAELPGLAALFRTRTQREWLPPLP